MPGSPAVPPRKKSNEVPPADLLTALSPLRCAATIVLWVRSYFRADSLHQLYVPDRQRHGVIFQAHLNRGMADVLRYDLRNNGPPVDGLTSLLRRFPRWSSRPARPNETAAERYLLAVRYDDTTYPVPAGPLTERVRRIVVPLWAGVLLFAAAPLLRRAPVSGARTHRCPAAPNATTTSCHAGPLPRVREANAECRMMNAE